MSLKKNWFARSVWAVYSIMLCIFLATYVNAQCIALKFGKYATIVTVCLVCVGILGIYRLLCLLYEKWGQKLKAVSNRSKSLLEVFLVLSLFAGAILIRVYRYVHQFTECFGTMQFYEMAAVKEGISIPVVSHGASYLYTGMLSLLFSLLGNKLAAGIVMQLVLQLAGILLFYLAMRNLTGKTEAVLSMSILAFFSSMLDYGFTLMPENLYFCLFSGMLFLISLLKKYEEKEEQKMAVSVLLLFMLGIGAGYMTYLDVIGMLLLAGICFVVLAKKGNSKRNIIYISVVTGIFLVTLFLMFFLEAVFENTSFINAVFSWWNLYFVKFSWNYMLAGPDLTLSGNLVVCTGAAWCIFGFLRKKDDSGCFYMLSLIVLAVFVSFGSQNMSYQLLVTAYWSVLAALGITSVTVMKDNRDKTEVTGEMLSVLTVDNMAVKAGGIEAALLQIEEMESKSMENSDKKPIQFIENPLPLPKKHVKKTMDYKFEPEEHLMKYDIEVNDDDDFDLQ